MLPHLIFQMALARLNEIQAIVGTFRNVARIGLPHALESIRKDSELIAPLVLNFTRDSHSSAQEFAQRLANTTAAQAQASVDAATIVFVHAFFDDFINTMLKILMIENRGLFLKRIGDRKVLVKDIKEKGFEQIVSEKIVAYVFQLERESLRKKLEIILSACPNTPDTHIQLPMRYLTTQYKFDLANIEKIDALRHELIHKNAFGKPVPNAATNYYYLLDTAGYIAAMLAAHYELPFEAGMLER